MSRHKIKIADVEFTIFKDEMIFGDGLHETTALIMKTISKLDLKDKSIIDVGTGTGILSILCKKLGASHVLAIDISKNSLEWAKVNFSHNGVDIDVKVNNYTLGIDDEVDIILSNLPTTEQVENVKTVAKNMHKDSILIMSWWNKLKFEDYVRGFEIIEHIEGDDYDAYVLKKNI